MLLFGLLAAVVLLRSAGYSQLQEKLCIKGVSLNTREVQRPLIGFD